MTHNKSEPSKIAPSGPRHTTSASVTNREVTRVGYRHGFQEGQMIGNRKQSVTNDTDVQKGNVMAVETKQKDNLKNRLKSCRRATILVQSTVNRNPTVSPVTNDSDQFQSEAELTSLIWSRYGN
ncbi:hypothetical protein YC2023_079034 [Brassica napus]